MGYDGKGQHPIKKIEDLDNINIDFSKEYILEKLVKLQKEISVILTRFGNNKYGTPAVLELRAYDTPFIIRDGQLVGQLNYYEIEKIKKEGYGIKINSNYFNQNLKLAKQFK